MWILLLSIALSVALLGAPPQCGPGNTVTGSVYLLCNECKGRVAARATIRLESDAHVAEVVTDNQGMFEIRNLPPGDYRPTMRNHRLAWGGGLSRVRVPQIGCVYAGLLFSAHGPTEQAEEALMTARNYLVGAIDLMKEWFR